MKRLLLTLAGIASGLLLVAAVGSWLLSRWLPRYGQAKLEAAVEERWPVDLTIGRMRYDLLRGLTITDATITDTRGRTVFAAPELHVRPRWAGLLLGRIGFGGDAVLEAPYRAQAVLAGWVRFGGSAWRLDAQTAETPLSALASILADRKPPALADGRFVARVRLDQPGHGPVQAQVRIEGRRLRWAQPPVIAVADVTVDGNAAPDAAGAWRYDLAVSVRDGRVDSVPAVQSVSNIAGAGRLTPEALRIDHLSADTLGNAWRAEGEVALPGRPVLAALITGTTDAGQVPSVWPAAAEWKPGGPMEVRASCRAALAPKPAIDCQAHATLRDATIALPVLSAPLKNVNGQLDYDLVERRVSIESLTAELDRESVTARGQLALARPPSVALSLDGIVTAAAARGWLEQHGVTEPAGRVQFTIDLDGPADALRPAGRIELQRIGGRIGGQRIADLTGALTLSPEQAVAEQLRLTLNDQPVTLSFSTTTGAVPAVRAEAQLPGAKVAATARVLPGAVEFKTVTLELAHSQLRAEGAVSRSPGAPVTARVRGTVDLADLTSLAWLPMPSLQPWALAGRVTLDAVYDGPATAWRNAAWHGRLQGENVRIKDVPVDQAAGEFEHAAGATRVRLPVLAVAGGRGQGELTLEPRDGKTLMAMRADISQLQLERLAQALPSWRGHDIQGAASASAQLSGLWEDRAAWTGQGWLSASGDHLGDLPVLEKVFQGLFGVLADRLGLDSLRRGQITQAAFQWELSQARFRTDDFRLSGTTGGEPMAVYAHGSVGWDRTLDFVIEPELSEGVVLEAPTTAGMATTVLKAANRLDKFRRLIGRHRLTGTLAQPQYRFEFSLQDVLKQLAPAPEELLQGLFNTLGGGS